MCERAEQGGELRPGAAVGRFVRGLLRQGRRDVGGGDGDEAHRLSLWRGGGERRRAAEGRFGEDDRLRDRVVGVGAGHRRRVGGGRRRGRRARRLVQERRHAAGRGEQLLIVAIETGGSDALQLGEPGVVIGSENARHRFIELAARLFDGVGRGAVERRRGGHRSDLESAIQNRRAREAEQEAATALRRQGGEEAAELAEILRAVDGPGLRQRAGEGLQKGFGVDGGAEARGVLPRQSGDAVDLVLIGFQHDLAPQRRLFDQRSGREKAREIEQFDRFGRIMAGLDHRLGECHWAGESQGKSARVDLRQALFGLGLVAEDIREDPPHQRDFGRPERRRSRPDGRCRAAGRRTADR